MPNLLNVRGEVEKPGKSSKTKPEHGDKGEVQSSMMPHKRVANRNGVKAIQGAKG